MQERYNRLGVDSRVEGKMLKKLGERKYDIRWKVANIVVITAGKKQYAIVMKKLGEKPASNMIARVRDRRLRHRIYQASFRGIQMAIEEKAREYRAPIIYVNPKDTSRLCPVHKAVIAYYNTRIDKHAKGGKHWHKDVAACWNTSLKACLGDRSPVPLGSQIPVGEVEVSRGKTPSRDKRSGKVL